MHTHFFIIVFYQELRPESRHAWPADVCVYLYFHGTPFLSLLHHHRLFRLNLRYAHPSLQSREKVVAMQARAANMKMVSKEDFMDFLQNVWCDFLGAYALGMKIAASRVRAT